MNSEFRYCSQSISTCFLTPNTIVLMLDELELVKNLFIVLFLHLIVSLINLFTAFVHLFSFLSLA